MCYDEPLVPNDVLVEFGIPGVKGVLVLCGIKMMTRRYEQSTVYGVLRSTEYSVEGSNCTPVRHCMLCRQTASLPLLCTLYYRSTLAVDHEVISDVYAGPYLKDVLRILIQSDDRVLLVLLVWYLFTDTGLHCMANSPL